MPFPMNSTANRFGNAEVDAARTGSDSSHGSAIAAPTPRRTVRLETELMGTASFIYRCRDRRWFRLVFARVFSTEQQRRNFVQVPPPDFGRDDLERRFLRRADHPRPGNDDADEKTDLHQASGRNFMQIGIGVVVNTPDGVSRPLPWSMRAISTVSEP